MAIIASAIITLHTNVFSTKILSVEIRDSWDVSLTPQLGLVNWRCYKYTVLHL